MSQSSDRSPRIIDSAGTLSVKVDQDNLKIQNIPHASTSKPPSDDIIIDVIPDSGKVYVGSSHNDAQGGFYIPFGRFGDFVRAIEATEKELKRRELVNEIS